VSLEIGGLSKEKSLYGMRSTHVYGFGHSPYNLAVFRGNWPKPCVVVLAHLISPVYPNFVKLKMHTWLKNNNICSHVAF